ncbi:unnamed protein product, partial [Polarella glacialis]
MADSPHSNGFLVRCVGRRRIRDGSLSTSVTVVKALLTPWLVVDLLRARKARESWAECLFQLYSMGQAPPSLPLLVSANPGCCRFVCISDTHQCHDRLPPLPAGDVLVHCGDFTNFGSRDEVRKFALWMASQPHGLKLVVPGNHDMILDENYYDAYWGDWSAQQESHSEAVAEFTSRGIQLLVDKSIEVHGLHVYGSPWVTRYASWKTAFNKESEAMGEHWQSVPDGVDVLLTHMPPLGVGDRDQ